MSPRPDRSKTTLPVTRSRRERVGPVAATSGRIAAIDIGSNSIHMVIVERGGPAASGSYQVLARERDMVRLGKSALADGALSQKAMRKGLEALLKMTTLARLKGAGEIVAVATSAVREAANGSDFLAQVRALTGLDVRILSGEEEGALIFRAVQHAVDLSQGSVVLADVGGGSTEWCVARRGDLRSVQSVPLGSLRCSAMLEGDPPSPRSIERLRRAVREGLAKIKTPKTTDRMIATSGTAACCGDLADLLAGRERGAMIGGLRELRVRELNSVVAGLQTLTVKEIAALPPVGAPRAGSILAGAVLLQELAARAGVDRLHLCDRALREGLVLEAHRRAGVRSARSRRRSSSPGSGPRQPGARDARPRPAGRASRGPPVRPHRPGPQSRRARARVARVRCPAARHRALDSFRTPPQAQPLPHHHRRSRRLRPARDRDHRRGGALPPRRSTSRAPRHVRGAAQLATALRRAAHRLFCGSPTRSIAPMPRGSSSSTPRSRGGAR